MTNLQIKDYCEAEFENIDKVVSEVGSIMQLKEEGFTIVNFEIPDYWGIGGLVLNLIQDRCREGLER